MPADIDWAMLVAYHRGCDAVRVEAEVNISYLERLFIKEIAEENQAKGISLAHDICKRCIGSATSIDIGIATTAKTAQKSISRLPLKL